MTNVLILLISAIAIVIVVVFFVFYIKWLQAKHDARISENLELINKLTNDIKDMSKNMTDRVMSFSEKAYERFKDSEADSVYTPSQDIPAGDEEGIDEEFDKKSNTVKTI